MATHSTPMGSRTTPSLNYVIVSGTLGRDAKITPGGAMLSLAINNFTKDHATGKITEFTCWRSIYVKNPLAESLSKYLTKGKTVLVTGRMDTWKPKNPGEKGFEVIIAERVILFDRPGTFTDREAVADPADRAIMSGTHKVVDEPGFPDDDIPF